MNRLGISKYALICFSCTLFTSETSTAQSKLLAELRREGFCSDCPPTEIRYEISFTNQDFPAPVGSRAEWSILAGPINIGQTFSIPSNLIPFFNNVLTYSGPVLGRMICCSGDVGEIHNIIDNEMGTVIVDRTVPILGPNLFGYHVSNLTMTIDQLDLVPIGGGRFSGPTTYTVRIFGIPEPLAIAQSLLGMFFVALRIRLPRRQFRPR
jgi:hypothetical protein